MFPGVDHLKAQTLFHYCAKSTTRLVQRDFVRLALEEQLKKLRKIGDKDYKKQLAELERKISAAIVIEKTLKGHHSDEDVFHRKLRDKVDKLDKKLGFYLKSKESRKQRVRELETKVLHKISPKSQKVSMIKADLKKLENMHKELSETGKYKKKLQLVDKRIAQLKAKLKRA